MLQRLVLCPGIENPALIDRCVDVLLPELVPDDQPALVVGVADARAADGGGAHADSSLGGDQAVIACLRRLRIVFDGSLGSGLLLHGALTPAFVDCRGEIQELPDVTAGLSRSDVAETVTLMLSRRPPGPVVRQLVLDNVDAARTVGGSARRNTGPKGTASPSYQGI